jgi:predicted transcriptional regulator
MQVRRSRGELEATILRALWASNVPLSAREIVDGFGDADNAPALTTVLTVLDRLRTKGRVVKQETEAGGFVFSPTESESRFAANSMLAALVSSSDRSAALLRFAGELDERDVELLRKALGPDATSERDR